MLYIPLPQAPLPAAHPCWYRCCSLPPPYPTADQVPLVINGETVACVPGNTPDVGGVVDAIGAEEVPGPADVW